MASHRSQGLQVRPIIWEASETCECGQAHVAIGRDELEARDTLNSISIAHKVREKSKELAKAGEGG